MEKNYKSFLLGWKFIFILVALSIFSLGFASAATEYKTGNDAAYPAGVTLTCSPGYTISSFSCSCGGDPDTNTLTDTCTTGASSCYCDCWGGAADYWWCEKNGWPPVCNDNSVASLSMTCATSECPGADYIFNANMWIVGNGCYSPNRIQDSIALNVNQGTYKVEVRSQRGNPDQSQISEKFYFDINGQKSSISQDDSNANSATARWENFGNFNFNQGSNIFTMRTAATCPPDYTPNSVDVSKICLYYQPKCGDGRCTSGETCSNCATDCGACPRCGDGVVNQASEQCDDGNLVNTDACTNTCRLPVCGDGIVRTGVEACDDGNSVNTDACTNTCNNSKCGDGIIQTGVDQCDDGNLVNTDACTNTCKLPVCGDGIIQTGVDQCDDGNSVNTDACTNTCTTARCGDGIIQTGVDQCDDGNLVNTDACTNTCRLPVCGDGIVRTGVEACDDGNDNGEICIAPYNGACSYCNQTCNLINLTDGYCGDGVKDVGYEECDGLDGVGLHQECSSQCNVINISYCGDGVVNQANETCDDGNLVNTDACTNTCRLPVCGDGIVRTGVEACDDGNSVNTDACTNTCRLPVCGDGIVRTGVEACDDGNDNGEVCIAPYNGACSYCNETCNLINLTDGYCGDDVKDVGYEECDGLDGVELHQECSQTCTLIEIPWCGNDVLDLEEQCDEGNDNGLICTAPYNGSCTYCNSTCNPIILTDGYCGDGVKDVGYEECDGLDGVGAHQECSSTCNLIDIPWCGNDVLDLGEQCDEGNDNGEVCIAPYNGACSYCNQTCSSIILNGPYCGDGVKDGGYEECDGSDGVFTPGYDCNEFCQSACMHDVAIRYTYSSSLGTGIAIKPELGSWMLDDPEELEKGQDYIVKYYVDNKIVNSTNNIHVILKIDNETLADYNTSINIFHHKNVNWDISNLSEGTHYLNLFVEKINEGDCNNEDNYASREIIILPYDGPICGNKILDLNETCDNGSNNGQICTAPYEGSCDYCDDSCNLITLTDGYCGDGVKDVGYEECDGSDGINSNQSCNSDCQLEDIPWCGNDILNFGEECDEGSNNGKVCIPVYEGSCNYCSNSCEMIVLNGSYCGDGIKDEGYEECDGLDGLCPVQICNEECRLIIIPYCGDGVINQANETCDDGNLINEDGCSSICQEEKECATNSDCSDGLFCNGEETCKNYECIHGMPPQVDDGLFCTEDICNESLGIVTNKPINIDDTVECTVDICDENVDEIFHVASDDYCDDGLFCNGEETCNSKTGCKSGISVDCSAFNLIGINTCTHIPDSNPFTLDYALGFTSTCNEFTQSCRTGNYTFTHTCNSDVCDAECEDEETQSIQCGTNVGECEYGEIELECTKSCEWESENGKECVGEVGPEQEICDTLDNDCDGEIDEGLVDAFGRISYSTVNTGDVLAINGYSNFTEERIDFFHGYVHQRDGNYLGFGSMHARGKTTNGTEIQLNVKFDASELVEYTCTHITWRNSARGTYWINGVGTVTVEYDYMDITYWFATGKIDAVGYGKTNFEFKNMIDRNLISYG